MRYTPYLLAHVKRQNPNQPAPDDPQLPYRRKRPIGARYLERASKPDATVCNRSEAPPNPALRASASTPSGSLLKNLPSSGL